MAAVCFADTLLSCISFERGSPPRLLDSYPLILPGEENGEGGREGEGRTVSERKQEGRREILQ